MHKAEQVSAIRRRYWAISLPQYLGQSLEKARKRTFFRTSSCHCKEFLGEEVIEAEDDQKIIMMTHTYNSYYWLVFSFCET